jgi:hypothetical protein
MGNDEVLTVQQCMALTKQSERRVRAALASGALAGVPGSRGVPGAVLKSDALQWIRNGAPEIVAYTGETENG